MAAIVNRQVNVYITSGDAQKELDKLTAKEKLLNAELAKTADPKRIKALNAELAKLSEPISRAHKKLKGELLPTFRDLEIATRKWLNEFKKTGDPVALANFQKFNKELQITKQQINGLDNAQQGLTKKGIFSAAFWASLASSALIKVTSLIGNFFGGVVKEALDADEATRRLESTLNNLGRSDAFDRITRKADELAKQFRFLDNDDIVAVFNKLIDYGKLTEKEMDNLLPVIINFASKSKISIAESASVIIKALEGNSRALKEYGIDIKEGGTETERLNIIMTTLKEKTDGAADAFQKSAKGGIAVARQELNNLKEDIGNVVIPALTRLLGWVVSAVKGVVQFGKDVRAVFDLGFRRSEAEKENRIIDENTARTQVDNFLARIANETEEKKIELLNKEIVIEETLIKLNNEKAALAKTNDLHQEKTRAALQDQNNRAVIRLKLLKDELALFAKTPLGISQPDGPDKEAEKKLKKAAEAYAKFLEKVKDLNSDFDASNQEGFEKDLALLQHKINNLKQEAAEHKNNKEALLQIDILYRKEVLALIDKYAIIDKEKIKKASEEQAKIIGDSYKKLRDLLKNFVELTNQDKLAALDFNVLTSRGDKKFTAQKAKREFEKNQEIEAEIQKAMAIGLTRVQAETSIQNVIKLIKEKYRKEDEELQKEHILEQIDIAIDYAQQAFNIAKAFGDAATERENAELERDRKANDQKQKNLERRLKAGTITQLQYNRELDRMNNDLASKEKKIAREQFERKKRESIAQAFINMAQGITKAIAEYAWPYNLIVAGITAGLATAQIVNISKQDPPELAEGGKLGGRSHAAGGNAVVDGSGRKIAEVEEGEGIVNKRTMADRRPVSVSGTPGQIISRLNGLYGKEWEGGATLIPGWRNFNPQRMNFAAMKGVYAAGGRFNTQNTTSQAPQNAIFENLSDMISDMQATMRSIQQNGIPAYTILTQHEKTQTRLDAIRADATMIK